MPEKTYPERRQIHREDVAREKMERQRTSDPLEREHGVRQTTDRERRRPHRRRWSNRDDGVRLVGVVEREEKREDGENEREAL